MTTIGMSTTGTYAILLLLCVAVGMIALATLGQTANITVTTNTHAIEQHGQDALRARLAVFNCDPRFLQVWAHDELIANPYSLGKWLVVCPNSTATQCAGMVIGTTPDGEGAYPEFTAFVSGCRFWTVTVPTRDGFAPAPVVILRKALSVILFMKEASDECE